MAEIVRIPEMYTDEIVDAGVSRRINMHMRVIFDDGRDEWHYFGTPVPGTVTATQHPDIKFPEDFLNVPDASDILYSMGLEVALENLRHPIVEG